MNYVVLLLGVTIDLGVCSIYLMQYTESSDMFDISWDINWKGLISMIVFFNTIYSFLTIITTLIWSSINSLRSNDTVYRRKTIQEVAISITIIFSASLFLLFITILFW